jgi:hypothetical protein
MSSAVTQPELYGPVAERKAKALSVSKPEPKPEVHFWKIGATISKQGDGAWIFFVVFGIIALLVTIPAFVTLYHLLNTDSLTHFVEMALR